MNHHNRVGTYNISFKILHTICLQGRSGQMVLPYDSYELVNYIY